MKRKQGKFSASINLFLIAIIALVGLTFDIDEHIVVNTGKVAGRIVVKGPYEIVHYAAPQTIDTYNTGKLEQRVTKQNCGDQFALLIDDPHELDRDEQRLFRLLKRLQAENGETFRHMAIVQEGTFAKAAAPRSLKTIDAQRYPIVAESHSTWRDDDYKPINRGLSRADPDDIPWLLERFLGHRLSSDIAKTINNHFIFNAIRNESTTPSTQDAILQRIKSLDRRDARMLARRLERVGSGNEKFARLAMEELGLRPAYAFELFVEGMRSGIGASDKSVSVYGLDDTELYLASCLLADKCLPPMPPLRSFGTEDPWKVIQPYRDWRMAANVNLAMNDHPSPTIPIVLARVVTHLPLVGGALCELGYNSVTLKPKRSAGEILVGTVPYSIFHSIVDAGELGKIVERMLRELEPEFQ